MTPYAGQELPSETERAWAAGFFDGEGWIGSRRTKDYTYLKIAVTQTGTTSTLERFNAAIGGVGKIYARSTNHPGNWTPGWSLQVNRIGSVVFAVNLLWPYLSEPKREQTTAAFATRAAYRASWPAEFALPQQRLSDDNVREILSLCADGVTRRADIAAKFGICISTVYRIQSGKIRRDLI